MKKRKTYSVLMLVTIDYDLDLDEDEEGNDGDGVRIDAVKTGIESSVFDALYGDLDNRDTTVDTVTCSITAMEEL